MAAIVGIRKQAAQIRAIPTKRGDQKLIQHLTMPEIQAILGRAGSDDTAWIAGSGDDASVLRRWMRVSELVGSLLANLSLSRTPSLLVEGKRPKAAKPPALEGDCSRSALVALGPG